MSSHFESLGFDIRNYDEFCALIATAANRGKPLFTRSGRYLLWKIGNGIEMWAQMNQDGRLIGMNPHFRGPTTQIVGITRKFPFEETPLDGSFEAWANPEVDLAGDPPSVSGSYPFIFDSPAYTWFQNLPLPCLARVQLAAFAHHLEIQEDSKDGQPLEIAGNPLSDEFFFPVGTFEKTDEKTPEATACFGGALVSCQPMINPLSNRPFTLATIRTCGMLIDLLISSKLIDRPLIPGQRVSGHFWLSGMIKEILHPCSGMNRLHDPLLFECKIAGISYQKVGEQTHSLLFGDRLELKRETDNEYDEDAISVYTLDPIKLGYIPRAMNAYLAAQMDRGVEPIAHLVKKHWEPNNDIVIRVYLPSDPGPGA